MKLRLLLLFVGTLGVYSCNKNNEPKPDDSGRFMKMFGTAGMSRAYAVAETGGGFVLVGYSIQDLRSDKDIYIIKTDAHGNKEWERRIETSKDEIARDLRVEDNGNIVITGMQVQSNDSSQAVLITLDAVGGIVEQRKFGIPQVSEDAYHISKLSNGDYLVGGVRDSVGNKNMYLARIAEDSVVWEFNIGAIGVDDALNRVVEMSNGNLLWAGTASRAGGKNVRCVLSSPQGSIYWSYEYELNGFNEYGRDVIPTADGSFMMIGSRGRENEDDESLLLMKVDANGYKSWEAQPIAMTSGGYSIKPVSTGGYIVSGYKKVEAGNTDLLLLRLNDAGAVTWEKTFGGKRKDQGQMAIESSDGYFTMVGFTDLYLDQNNVFAMVKTDAEGNLNEVK